MKKLKVGILGAGSVASMFHMPSFHEIESCEVVAAYSHTKDVAEQFGQRWGIPMIFHGDDGLAKLCATVEVDILDIALPTNLHLPATVAAAENHKHVICEKPLARNGPEAKEMLDAVRRYGVMHFYLESHVFIPQIVRARELVEQGMLGQVFWVRCREARFSQHRQWFWDPTLAGGGALLDLGAHGIETSRYLLGSKPTSVLGWTSKLVHATAAEDNGLMLTKHEGGQLSQTESSWVTRGGLDLRVEVYGGNGTLFTNISRETGISLFTAEGGTKFLGPGESSTEVVQTKRGRYFPALGEHRTLGFVDALKHFASAATNGEKASETFEQGCLVNETIDAAYRSAKSGSWERL